MIESVALEYRAQAARYDALAKQADCPARESLYRRLARGYLTLSDLARCPCSKTRSAWKSLEISWE
jgi:hypothetical protein